MRGLFQYRQQAEFYTERICTPALAAGRTRFVLYNRSGNELRVESRTQNLYTKTTENGLYLCAVAPDGKVATVTGEVRNVAELVVYSPTMTQQLSWGLTSAEGIPLRMEFAPGQPAAWQWRL